MIQIALKTLFTRTERFLIRKQRVFVLDHYKEADESDDDSDINYENYHSHISESRFYEKLL